MTADKAERLIIGAIILVGWAFYMFVLWKIHNKRMDLFLKTLFLTPITGERYVEANEGYDRNNGSEHKPLEIGDGRCAAELSGAMGIPDVAR